MRMNKLFAVGASIAASACIGLSMTGCYFGFDMTAPLLSIDELAESLAVSLLGNSAYNWNVFSVDPKRSFGVELEGDAEWFKYNAISASDVRQTQSAFRAFRSELKKYNPARLDAKDAIAYRSLEYTLNTYIDYYGSDNALDFELINAPYINAHGGYVAEFASAFENYAFRSDDDVENLLDITESTRSAFLSYLEYAGDRADRGFPLYDYTVCAMQDFLDDVSGQGGEYYLYTVANSKLDAASFLSASERAEYKIEYARALDQSFMSGVRELSSGLERYKGNVVTTEQSYLAEYGDTGRDLYQWLFEEKTGIRNANILNIYNEMLSTYFVYSARMDDITDAVDAVEHTDPDLYNAFYAYVNGDAVLLGLTEPDDILDYLKEAAKNIVPDLSTTPDIEVKYMDRAAGEISSVLAYYLMSPIDESNSVEHITLNPHTLEQDASQLLITVAHEGYPGHLYAYVNAKEKDLDMLSLVQTCSAFSEGWAKYTEIAVLENIAAHTDDRALKLYCEYAECSDVVGYLNMTLLDIQVNYLGESVNDFIARGIDQAQALSIVETLMEDPAVYVPYGYGMHVMLDIHDNAKTSLGSKYDEVEFNGYILSEGMGPTIPRAKELAAEYISENG